MRFRLFNGRSIVRFILIAIGVVWLWQACSPIVTVWYPQTIISSPAAENRFSFGRDIATDANTLVVGSPRYREKSDKDEGVAYVYVHDGTQWVQQARISSDTFRSDRVSYFARSVDLSGNTLVLGTKTEVADSSVSTGLVYIFIRQGETWQLQAKLAPPETTGISFADELAIDGDTLAVTGIGAGYMDAVYVFQRDPATSTWAHQAKLLSPDRNNRNAAYTPCTFGSSVDISGDTIVVGSAPDYVRANCAHVFVRNRDSHIWSHQAQLQPLDETHLAGFGHSVAIDQDTIVVGASDEGIGLFRTIWSLGSAYVYRRDPASRTWNREARLTPRGAFHPIGSYHFGSLTAIHGNKVLVANNASSDNAVYLFNQLSVWGWQQRAKIVVGADERLVGHASIAVTDQHIVIAGLTRNKEDERELVSKLYILNIQSLQ